MLPSSEIAIPPVGKHEISGIAVRYETASPPIRLSEQSSARIQLLSKGPKEIVQTATIAFVAWRRLCLPVTFGSRSTTFKPMYEP